MASSGSQKRNVVYGVPMGEPEGVQPVLQADLSGRTVVITGATGGLGLEAGKHFAKMRPKRMILTGRTEEKCREVEDIIRKETGFAAVECWQLELSEFASVKAFVNRFEKENANLDVLVENAGVFVPDFELTSDGFEKTIQVNHISGALLAILLLPRLLKTAQKNGTISRVVFVSSGTHFIAGIADRSFPDDAKILKTLSTKEFAEKRMTLQYPDSKVMNVLFARTFQAAIPRSMPVVVTAVDPGCCHSEIRRSFDQQLFQEVLQTARTTEEGGRQLIYAALGPDPAQLDSIEATWKMRGAYVVDAEIGEPSSFVKSDDGAALQERIWNETLEAISEIDSRVVQALDILKE